MIVVLPALPALTDHRGLDALRENQFAYWTYLLNVAGALNPMDYAAAGQYANSHFWSLAVEEQFYLIWPLIVLVLPAKRLAAFCVFCIVAAPLFRFALLQETFPSLQAELAAYTLMPSRMDTLAVGALIAIVVGQPEVLRRAQRWLRPVAIVSALSLVAMGLNLGRFNTFDEPVQIAGYSILALMFGAVVAAAASNTSPTLQKFCSLPGLKFFGIYSYAIYVFHFQIGEVGFSQIQQHGGLPTVGGSYIPAQLVAGAVLTAIVVGVSMLSWHLFEKHFLKLKRFVQFAGEKPEVLSPVPVLATAREP
jgi:peptidoglycan/LPS O-acetylase OafA/YrhL